MALTQLKTGAIADDAVTTDKLANAINTARDANTAKTTNATHSGDVTGSGALTIANDAVTTVKIADNAVTADKIVGSAINSARLADDAVTTAKIADNAVTADQIASNAVTTARIADDAVTSAKIADGTIVAANIANDTITATQLANNSADVNVIVAGAVTTAKLADDAVTLAKMANDSVSSSQIINNAVTVNALANDAVTTDKINNNAVDMNKLSDLDNGRIIARVSSGSGNPEAATAAQIRTLLNVEDGATAGGGGLVKVASRRYYGFDQTTGIGNAGFTKITKAFVTITPSSSSNSIRLSGTMNWSGSDTEHQYSFRWRREISGGATTSLDSDMGSGNRPGVQTRLIGNGDLATVSLGPVIDQPSTTSAITYYIETFCDGGNQSLYLNRSQQDHNDPASERAASYFIAEELDNSIHTHTNTNS